MQLPRLETASYKILRCITLFQPHDFLSFCIDSCSSQNQLHPIVGNVRFESAFTPYPAQLCCQATLIASDNLGAAVRDDCSQYPLFRTLTQLRTDGRMPDEGIAALPNERPRERRAVPNVKLHILQRRRALMNEKKIRPIKNARSARVDPISDGWRGSSAQPGKLQK